jgi:hypothetical protein
VDQSPLYSASSSKDQSDKYAKLAEGVKQLMIATELLSDNDAAEVKDHEEISIRSCPPTPRILPSNDMECCMQ